MTPEQLLEQLVAAERGAVERGATGPPAETAERVWGAVEARLANGPAPPELDQGPLLEHAAEAAANVGGSSSVALKIVGALAIVGAVGGGLALLGDRDRSAEQIAAVVEPSAPTPDSALPQPAPEPALPEPEPEPALPEPEPETLEPTLPEPSTPAITKVKVPPKAPKTLADEVALMQAISTALKQGDSRKVLTLIAEHERDFGKGQFIEERRAAKARALCQAGKHAAGKNEAASFTARWPDSIHLSAVKQDCGLE